MRSIEERQKVIKYLSLGLNDVEISKLCKIPRTTINGWKKNPIITNPEKFNPEKYIIENNLINEYSYILGLYLGDGYINKTARTWKLRIFLDEKYSNLNNYIISNLMKLFPKNKIKAFRFSKSKMVTICVHSKKIIDLFPQHGKGKKHERKIKLTDWQENLINSNQLIKGLFHSDGCYYIRKIKGRTYPAYDFRNESDDLHFLFKKHLEKMGICCTFSTKPKNTHVYKKEHVDNLEKLIGTKQKILL